MASSSATTVTAYLSELPEAQRAVVAAVRNLILAHLPQGYEETMNWGMICYEVPLSRFADTYNGQPLGYLALAAQKRYYALYLSAIYSDPEKETRLRAAFEAMGKKADVGKSCVRFRKLEDLPLDAIGELIAETPPDAFIAEYTRGRNEKKREKAT